MTNQRGMRMGNQQGSTTTRSPLLGDASTSTTARYGTQSSRDGYRAVDNDDGVVYNASVNNVSGSLEYQTETRRRTALIAILICQVSDWTAFSIVAYWIPQTLQLNVAFFNSDGQREDYLEYMQKTQMIPCISLILLYSAAWLFGIMMDSCIRKTVCLATSVLLVASSFSIVVSIILTLAKHVDCHVTSHNLSAYSCNISSTFFLCGTENISSGYCQDIYFGWVCTIAVLGAIIRTALPALGGDQIPERRGVRVFYAQFYGGQKLGQALAATLCLVYLSAWESFSLHKHSSHYHNDFSIQSDYIFLFYGWSVAIAVAAAVSVISMIIVVCGKVIREVRPDFSVVKTTAGIWREAKVCPPMSRYEDETVAAGCLSRAKMSHGGRYPDRAVDERTDLGKFGIVLLLLIPVAFGTTLPILPVMPKSSLSKPMKDVLKVVLKDTRTLAISSICSYVTSGVAIFIIHKMCTELARRGRALTLLHRLVCGHVAMIVSIATAMILQAFFKNKYEASTAIAPMVLVGLSNAFVYTAGYELTLMSAPRSMQGTAMGMFYLMDGIANVANMLVVIYTSDKGSHLGSLDYYLVMGVGGLASMTISCISLVLADKKFHLGVDRL